MIKRVLNKFKFARDKYYHEYCYSCNINNDSYAIDYRRNPYCIYCLFDLDKIIANISRTTNNKNWYRMGISFFKSEDVLLLLLTNEVEFEKDPFIQTFELKDDISNKLLLEIIRYSIETLNDDLFFKLFEKYKKHLLFAKFYQANLGFERMNYPVKIGDCYCCRHDRRLISFDCNLHDMCTVCYLKIKECGECRFPKHQSRLKLFDFI
jgi:hypothetical protein